jgi:hypothetical protein
LPLLFDAPSAPTTVYWTTRAAPRSTTGRVIVTRAPQGRPTRPRVVPVLRQAPAATRHRQGPPATQRRQAPQVTQRRLLPAGAAPTQRRVVAPPARIVKTTLRNVKRKR